MSYSLLPTTLHTIRIEEDDDRMKAIQSGKAAVEKEYSTLGSNISTEDGSLDISKLADPNTVSGTSEPVEPAPTTAPRKVGASDQFRWVYCDNMLDIIIAICKDRIALHVFKSLYCDSLQASRPAMIEKRESGYLSSSSSYPSPHSSAMPSPPQSVATPPDSALYTVSQENLHQSLFFTTNCNGPLPGLDIRGRKQPQAVDSPVTT